MSVVAKPPAKCLTYLAQIQRKPINRVELHLLALHYQRDDLWAKLGKVEVIPVSADSTKLPDDSLCLATFSESKRLINIVDVTSSLPAILHNLSLRIIKSLGKEREIKDHIEEMKKSLEYQSRELSDRAAKLNVRRDSLKEREQAILLRETYLSKENVILRKGQEALKRSWAALNLERQAMEKKSS